MRTVQQILEAKCRHFNTIDADTLVLDALNLISTLNSSYLIVIDNDAYKGIFSERDYSRNLILKHRSSATTRVSEVMTTDLPIVGINDTAEQCIHLANLYNTPYLLVYNEEGRFVSVLTIQDLLGQLLADWRENSAAASTKVKEAVPSCDIY